MIATAPDRSTASLVAGVSAALIVGQLGVVFAPFLLPFAMQRLAIGNLFASRLIAGELLAYLLAAFFASSATRFAPRAAAATGCALYAAGSLGAALAPDWLPFFVARLLCGVGGGMALVAANRAIASHHGFARLLAFAIIAVIVVATLSLVAVPAIFEAYGAPTAYAALGGLAALATLACLGVRKGPRMPAVAVGTSLGTAAWLLVGAYFLSRLSDAALWPYIETFGGRVGLGPATVGLVLATATVLAIGGPLLALRIVSVRGIVLLFVATIALKTTAPFLMLLIPNQAAYVVAQILVSATVVLSGQIFLAQFSALDATGRLPGFASTAGLAADTSGLPIAAQVFAASSFAGIAALSTAIGVLALLVCIAAFRVHAPVSLGGETR